MTPRFDAIVLGGSLDALVAALSLARASSKVALLVPESEIGAELRTVEFLPGFRAAPLGRDLGWIPADILALSGLKSLPQLAPDPPLIAFGEDGPLALRRSPQASAQAIAGLSRRDGTRWLEFCREGSALAAFLAEIYRMPAPQIAAHGCGLPRGLEIFDLLRGLRRFRRLGRRRMQSFLHAAPAPIADLLDDWFESPLLKGALAALAVRDLCQGPRSGGTAFNWLHRQVGGGAQGFLDRALPQGGAGLLLAALMHQARERGVVIRTAARVARIKIENDTVRGIELASGEEWQSAAVLSALDPRQTLLGLIDPMHLEAETIQAIQRVRYRAVTSVALLALERLPPLPTLAGAPTGSFIFAPSMNAVERAFDATKYGQLSDTPVVELCFPSVADPALAPVGKHVAMLRIQYTPGVVRDHPWDDALREAVGARALRVTERYLPGFGAAITGGLMLAPPDLERLFGLHAGAIGGPELALDQMMFMRPFAGAARHALPVRGVFVCGPGTHPGPGIAGISGLHAARAVLRWQKSQPDRISKAQ